MSKKVSEVLTASMAKVREMVDANTVVGAPIIAGDVTLIPVSKISFGIGAGGADMAAKTAGLEGNFGGGAGCGVNITPVAFLVVQSDRVRMLPISEPASTAAERIIEQLPAMVDRLSELLQSKKGEIAEI